MVTDRCTDEGQKRQIRLKLENVLSFIGEEESQLKLELAAKQVEVDELNFELSSIRATRKRLQRRAESFRSAELEVGADAEASGEAGVQEPPVCGVATVEDVKDCQFQYEALRRIAEKNGGILELSKGVDVVIAALVPKGKRSSVLSTQGRRIRESPDWTRIGKGLYRLELTDSSKIVDVVPRTDKPNRRGKSEQVRVEGRAA